MSDWDTKGSDEKSSKWKTVLVASAIHKTYAEHGPNAFGVTPLNEVLVSKKQCFNLLKGGIFKGFYMQIQTYKALIFNDIGKLLPKWRLVFSANHIYTKIISASLKPLEEKYEMVFI